MSKPSSWSSLHLSLHQVNNSNLFHNQPGVTPVKLLVLPLTVLHLHLSTETLQMLYSPFPNLDLPFPNLDFYTSK